jgi:hypothetical protein
MTQGRTFGLIFRRARGLRAVSAAAALSSIACGDPLTSVELIDKTRIVAARVEVAGDPTRAAPLPGESVEVRWLVVAPEPDPALAFALRSCLALETRSDATLCASSPLATASSLDPVVGAPTLRFDAPADAVGNERLAVHASVCPAGESLPSEGASRCSGGSEVLAAALDFSMDDGLHPNSNPTFEGVLLDGVELPPETAATTDCAALTSVPRGSKHTLRVELDELSRDPLPQDNGADLARENLLVSYFIDQGDLDHAWSSIKSTAPVTAGSAVLTAPASVGAVPRLARFVVVVRDGRGGSDFVERRICVEP